MHLIYIVLFATIVTLFINGWGFQRTLWKRFTQVDAPMKEMPSFSQRLFATLVVFVGSPILGALILSASNRHHIAISACRGFFGTHIISEADTKELYSWVIEEFPPTHLKGLD